jgi:hypothetical protein
MMVKMAVNGNSGVQTMAMNGAGGLQTMIALSGGSEGGNE